MRLQLYALVSMAATLTASCAAPPSTSPPPGASSGAAMSAAAPSDAFVSRAEAFVSAFNSRTPVSTLFVTEITDGQRRGLADADAMLIRMRDRLGPIVSIDRIEAETPHQGRVHVNLESRQASFRLGVEPAPPHRIVGMELGR